MNHITFWGNSRPTGTYVLWVEVSRDLAVVFGRFQGGCPVTVPAGQHLYVGSAMGRRGAASLAGRLLRHATRAADRPPHAIRGEMRAEFAAAGLRPAWLPLPEAKRLHWHIDYLLDEMAVEIIGVTVIRAASPLEVELAQVFMGVPGATPLAPGLGASDVPGHSHLLRLDGKAAGPARRAVWKYLGQKFVTTPEKGDNRDPSPQWRELS